MVELLSTIMIKARFIDGIRKWNGERFHSKVETFSLAKWNYRNNVVSYF